jgi:serine/threonine protein phosphatase 1
LGLFNSSRRPDANGEPWPKFPGGRVGYAIGDIHGRSDLLGPMIDRLEAEHPAPDPAAPPIVVFLGDYVDRGPDSRGVIEMLMQRRPRGFERRYLLGNHEAMLLKFIQDPIENRHWLTQGGMPTLISYGVPVPPAVASRAALKEAGDLFRDAMPPDHLEFILGLERYVVLGDYAMVHAGIDPNKPMQSQTDAELLWIRKKFLENRRRHDYMIVHGHTPTDAPYKDERRIGVDTGAYASGRLTAVKLHGVEAEFISVATGAG